MFSFRLSCVGPSGCELSGKRRLRCHFKNAVDVEDAHELTIETVDTACELGHARIEIDAWDFIKAVVGDGKLPERMCISDDRSRKGLGRHYASYKWLHRACSN